MNINNNRFKFRAWDKKLLKFHYFTSIFNNPIYTERSSFPQYESCKEYHDLEIAQFTGLQDKNGKDIYEGDIVQDNQGQFYKIIFKEKEAKFDLTVYGLNKLSQSSYHTMIWESKLLNIIGNIFGKPPPNYYLTNNSFCYMIFPQLVR